MLSYYRYHVTYGLNIHCLDGQTGSGKTHSIMGNAGIDEEEGIIPRAIKDIFHSLQHKAIVRHVGQQQQQQQMASSVRVSMVEIYNDDCKDLLHPDIAPRDIMIREDLDGRIFFTGAREEVVPDIVTAMLHLERGNLNRSTAETLMNATSSRSHAIFTISIEILEYNPSTNQIAGSHIPSSMAGVDDASEEGGGGSYIQAKLHLVDLAGSERAKRTGALGARLKESVGINQVISGICYRAIILSCYHVIVLSCCHTIMLLYILSCCHAIMLSC